MAWCLPLNVRGPSYLGLTWSISWLLMPWAPGSLCRQDISSYDIDCTKFVGPFLLEEEFEVLVPVSNQCEGMTKNVNICFMFPLKNLACKGLTTSVLATSQYLNQR